MSLRDTSFSTIASTRFAHSFVRAFSSRFSVSAAKPMSNGERFARGMAQAAEVGEDVGIWFELQLQRAVALDLLRCDALHVIVGHSGGHDNDARLLPAIEHGGAHLLRSFDEDGFGR